MNYKYDYLIVGSGLYGAVLSYRLTQAGNRCLVIDKRDHIAGNIYTESISGIQVHRYGPHIFHTDSKEVWDFINQFAEFNPYIHSPIAAYKDKIYNLPFNMNTFYQLWGTRTPGEAVAKIRTEAEASGIDVPSNLEEQAIKIVGKELYEILIKGYTEKQWGQLATELPSFIIKRLPVRLTYDNNYFNDRYQGIPVGGYTPMIAKMLDGADVQLNVDFLKERGAFEQIAEKIIYTGMIDEFYDYKFGPLEYRSLRFENEKLDMENYQGCAVVNFTEREVPYTRIIEHKHFEKTESNSTVITREYPAVWEKGKEAYYPINTEENMNRYRKYLECSQTEKHYHFGGRLATYRYMDMDDVIESALQVEIL